MGHQALGDNKGLTVVGKAESVKLGTKAQGLTPGEKVAGVMVQAEGGDVRYLFGEDPTAKHGFLLPKGDTMILRGPLAKIRFRGATKGARLTVQYLGR